MKTNKILIILLLTAAMAFCGALAACQPQEEQFTVTFISEGEQFHSYTAEKGSEVQFPESQPQKAEDEQYTYQFVGWSLSEGGVTVQSHTVTQNVTFYAVFEAHEKQPPAPVEYTVTFIDGVTQQVLKTEKVPAGGSATAPQAPQHVGYEFSRWQGDYQNVTARTDVTAVYVQKQYTLVRHYLGKQVTQTLHYGDAIPAESLESPVGLNFLGWFADSDCTQPVSEVYPDGMPDAERAVEVYAGYEVDLSSAVINLPANPVYGDSVTLSLPNTENVAFSYKWQTAAGAMEGASFSFEGAGSQTVTAVVTANYMDGLVITQKTLSATAKVAKRPLQITLDVEKEIIYGQTAQPVVTVTGLLERDSELKNNVTADIVCDGDKLAVGQYSVTVTGFNNDNYDVQVQQDEFTVQKATFTVTANMQGAADASLSYTVPEQFGIFTFKGTFYLTTTDEGVYEATDETSFNNYFAWQNGYAITVTETGEDVTANFRLAYDVTFTLTASDFVITLPSQLTVVYTGKPNSYGITVQDADQIEGISVTYAVKKDGTLSQFTETVPELTYAGQYTVYYRVSAPGYKTQEGSFTVTVERATPEINVPKQATEFTYTGERQYFNADGVTWSSREDGAELAIESFSFVTVAEGNGKQIKITSTETANYLSAEITVTLTVHKAQFTLSQPETQSYVYTGSAQGAPISVTALGDDQFTVWYNGGTTVAQFTDAGSYEVTVQVGGNDNYEDASTEYCVEIAKAPHNEIDVSRVNKQYVWDGQSITVSGATALFGTVQYKNSVLKSAGQWQVTAYVEGTTNYDGAEKQFTVYVAKGTYTDEQLQQALQNAVTGKVVFGFGKTLNDVPLAEGFAFSNPNAALSAKNFTLSDGTYVGSFDGTYCGDAVNYNPADVTITFTARKQKVTVAVEGISRKIGEVKSDEGLFTVTAQGENGALSAEEIEVLSVSVSHGINFDVGGTYDVTYTLGQNDYYDAAFENGEKEIASWFKLCSVLYDNDWYTLQDALKNATSGTVIVAANTVASNSSAYDGADYDAYYTVKKGVTLLVPYDKDHSPNTKDTKNCYSGGAPAVGTAYCTLTLAQA